MKVPFRRKKKIGMGPPMPSVSQPRGSRRRNIYRRFLYLDSNEVLNSLSSLEGGAIDKVLERILSTKEGKAGLSLDAWAARFDAGGKVSKDTEQQLERRRTAHSAVTGLLSALDAQREISQFSGAPNLSELEENMLIEFSADLYLGLTATTTKGETEQAKQLSSLGKRLAEFFGSPQTQGSQVSASVASLGRHCVGFARGRSESAGETTLVLALDMEYLLIKEPDDFSRRATIIAQVDTKPRQGEVVVIENSKDGLRAAVHPDDADIPELEALKDFVSFDCVLFDSAKQKAGRIPANGVILNPLCIYKASDRVPTVRKAVKTQDEVGVT